MSIHTTRNRHLVERLFSVDAICSTFDAATDAQWAEGYHWYPTAHAAAVDLADLHNVPTRTAVGVIAALSPQTGWEANLELAADLFAFGTCGHYRDALTKAQAIAADPARDPLDILGGPKVRSFYRNILEPDRPGPVTVDRHACAIAAGTDTSTYLRTQPKTLERKAVYRLVSGLYRSAAREYGLHPHTLQATTWVTHRARLSRGTF